MNNLCDISYQTNQTLNCSVDVLHYPSKLHFQPLNMLKLKAQFECRKIRPHVECFVINFSLCFIPLQVEAGDVILKVNGADVHRYSTKEGKSKPTSDPDEIIRQHSAANGFRRGKSLIIRTAEAHCFPIYFVAVLRCLRLSNDPVTLELKRGEDLQFKHSSPN